MASRDWLLEVICISMLWLLEAICRVFVFSLCSFCFFCIPSSLHTGGGGSGSANIYGHSVGSRLSVSGFGPFLGTCGHSWAAFDASAGGLGLLLVPLWAVSGSLWPSVGGFCSIVGGGFAGPTPREQNLV